MSDENKNPPTDPNPAADAAPKGEKAAKAEKADKAPGWQSADYDGPLTGEQAAWRRENIKPAKARIK